MKKIKETIDTTLFFITALLLIAIVATIQVTKVLGVAVLILICYIVVYLLWTGGAAA